MKKFIRSFFLLLILLLLWEVSLFAQSNVKDSLRAVYYNETLGDTARMDALDQLITKFYAYNGLAESVALCDSLYRFAEEKENVLYMGNAQNLKGIYYFYTGNYLEASRSFTQSLLFYKQLDRKILIANGYNNLGIIANSYGNYEKALHYFLKSVEIFENNQKVDSANLFNLYTNIGILYQKSLEDNKSARIHYEKALDIAIQINDSLTILKALSMRDINESFLGNTEQAEKTLLALIQECKKLGLKELEGNTYVNLGIHYRFVAEKAIEENSLSQDSIFKIQELGRESYSKAIKIKEALISTWGMGTVIYSLGNSYYYSGVFAKEKGYIQKANQHYKVAIDYYEMGFKHVDSTNIQLRSNLNYGLYFAHKELGNIEEAFGYLEEFKELNDSIASLDVQRQIAKKEYNYIHSSDSLEFAREQMISDLKIQNQEVTLGRQKALIIGGSIILVLISLLSFFFFFSRRRIRQDKEQLEKLNREKDGIINIVAHELRSPLTNAHSLLEVKMLEKEEDAAVLEDCQKEIDYVINMITDILDSHLLEIDHIESKMEEIELSKTLNQMLERFKRTAQQKSMQFITSGLDGICLKTDPKMLIRILENLLSNAIKFSPAESTVQLNADIKEEAVRLSVIDEGAGFSEQDKKKMYHRFQRLSAKPTSGENSFGLGLSLVKGMVEKLGIELFLESEKGKGAKFTLQFQRT